MRTIAETGAKTNASKTPLEGDTNAAMRQSQGSSILIA